MQVSSTAPRLTALVFVLALVGSACGDLEVGARSADDAGAASPVSSVATSPLSHEPPVDVPTDSGDVARAEPAAVPGSDGAPGPASGTDPAPGGSGELLTTTTTIAPSETPTVSVLSAEVDDPHSAPDPPARKDPDVRVTNELSEGPTGAPEQPTQGAVIGTSARVGGFAPASTVPVPPWAEVVGSLVGTSDQQQSWGIELTTVASTGKVVSYYVRHFTRSGFDVEIETGDGVAVVVASQDESAVATVVVSSLRGRRTIRIVARV